ncbi:MAG: leucine-rich repeat protein [Prevotella sp.]|nr:leucine-rich repeat protein [Candidatus Prevotella equi]
MKQTIQYILFAVALLLCSIGTVNAKVISGSCGTEMTYSLDTETGVLNIEGKGMMKNWSYYDYVPWYYSSSYIKTVTISDGVTSIATYAFCDCSNLTSINIPKSVTTIGSEAFRGCSGLSKAEFASLESLCKITFDNSGANPLSYAHNLYINGKEIKNLVIPNTLTSIGSYAFYNCSGLTSVTIPNSVTSVGLEAFSGCSGLSKAEFASLESLCKIRFDSSGANPLSYAHNLYINGKEIKNLVIPNTLTSIGSYAFCNCSGLTSVTIPNSLTSIGLCAFAGCSGLINTEFSSIESLCKINFGTLANPLHYTHNLHIDGKELKDLVVPNNVSSIGSFAFEGCSSFSTVIIPNSVTSIGHFAFDGCSGILDFINLSSAPQLNAGSLPTTATVHVLNGCKSAYSVSSAWNGYSIVEDAETFFPIESVSFENEKMYVKIGSVFKLTPAIDPSSAPASIYDLIWMSSDPSVLYLDQNTQRFMAMKEGTSTVTVTAIDANDNIKTAQVTVHVGDGIDPEESGDPQCEAPIVKYTNGNIICISATDDAVCHYTYKISGEGEGTDTGSSAGTPMKIEITAYATADGYRQSNDTIKNFDYVPSNSSLKCDVNGDGKLNMEDANIVVNTFLGK